MKIHVLIPNNIFVKLTKPELKWFNETFYNSLLIDFGNFDLNIVRVNDVKTFEFYAMEKHKSSISESDLIIKIIKLPLFTPILKKITPSG